ncbi:uncharacterized protein LOC118750032 [Rhagoletis pomonella]|uniref:uncharacterized protein LOC118750032 n=1 Tax=Rhagoletis pomonella TaxID=28610 RepID=UPI001784EBCF|nr:uncharacterized protein LOC118750032 [Rhagoletis pomonella]
MKSDSEAELFLRTDCSATYSEIRANFLANFGHIYSVSEVIDKLRKTIFQSAKTSVMGYILKMQEIASRAHIEEEQTVQFIIAGFQDTSPHIAVLYLATTIIRLKKLSHRYAQLHEVSRSQLQIFSQPPPSARPKSKSFYLFSESNIQCTNCSGYGHRSAACSATKREKGSCFRCGSTQHQLKNFPKPRPPLTSNQVALIDDVGESCIALEELNKVVQLV